MSGYDIKSKAEAFLPAFADAFTNGDCIGTLAEDALREAFDAGVRAMRTRAIDLINECREEGESDLRSARERIRGAEVAS